MRNVTLCLIFREMDGKRQVCLALKKRGFGQGLFNGFGGKVNEAEGETIEQATVRELKEESGVCARIEDLEKFCEIEFEFPHKQEWNQRMHVFCARKHEGNPAETEEMQPEWFSVGQIPLEKMWDADKQWLPKVLDGKKFNARAVYDEKMALKEFKFKE